MRAHTTFELSAEVIEELSSLQGQGAEIHHTQRFSLASTHDPHYLAPLCKEHHQLAHAVDLKVQEYWTT